MISNETILALTQSLGTPLYVIDEQSLIDAANSIDSAFRLFPAPVLVAYPYKTNSLREICSYMHNHGRLAEVASSIELEMALSLGIRPEAIIYNSPFKSDKDLHFALSIGCKLHIDNFPELKTVIQIVEELSFPQQINVGLRISTHTSFGWDRFGFDIENGEAQHAIEMLTNSDIKLISFHSHRSNIGTISEYEDHQARILEFIAESIAINNLVLDYIDLGSGFAIQWPKPKYKQEWKVPSLEDYSRKLNQLWRYYGFSENISLLIEPGRIAVAPAGHLYTKITNIKSRSCKQIISVDAGQNQLPGAELYEYNIRWIGKRPEQILGKGQKYEVYGTLCDSFDVLGTDVFLPETSVGDILSFDDVGGYDMSRSFSWQIPRPPVVWLQGANHKIIRHRENKDYLWLLNQP